MKTIYRIKCECNGRVYIGQTIRYNKRKKEHINDLKGNRHGNVYLQNDFNLYGIDAFQFEIIEEVEDDLGDVREDYWMEYYGGINTDRVYNSMNSYTKSKYMRSKLHNYYVGKSHIELYGKDKADHMRKLNSVKHMGKTASYIPYKGKVKTITGEMIEVTEDIYDIVMTLKNEGRKLKDISAITGIKSSGIHNIVHNKVYMPFKCND